MKDRPPVDHNFWIGLRNAMLIQLAVAAVVCAIVFFVTGCSGGSSSSAPVASQVVNTTPTGPDPPSVTPSTSCPSGYEYEPQTGVCEPTPTSTAGGSSPQTTPPPTCSGTGCSNAPTGGPTPVTTLPACPAGQTSQTTTCNCPATGTLVGESCTVPPVSLPVLPTNPSTPTPTTCVLPAINVNGVCTTYPPPNFAQVPTATWDINGVPQLQWAAVANNPQDTDDATLTCMVGTSGPYPASDTINPPAQSTYIVLCTESIDAQSVSATATLAAQPPPSADTFTYSGSLAVGSITYTWGASSASAQCGVTVYQNSNVIASSPYYSQQGRLTVAVSSNFEAIAYLQCGYPNLVNDTNVSPNPIIVTS